MFLLDSGIRKVVSVLGHYTLAQNIAQLTTTNATQRTVNPVQSGNLKTLDCGNCETGSDSSEQPSLFTHPKDPAEKKDRERTIFTGILQRKLTN